MSTPTGPTLAPGESVTVTAAPLPDSPWVAGNSPEIVSRVEGLQTKWGAVADGKFGLDTLSAAEDYTIPVAQPAPSPTQPAPTKPVYPLIIGSSTPPSGIDPAKIEAAAKALEKGIGTTLGGHRAYIDGWSNSGVNSTQGLKTIIANNLAAGRANYASMKPPGGSWQGWAPIIANSDAVKAVEVEIAKALQLCDGKGRAHLYSMHHEAENDRKDLSTLSATQQQAHRDQCYEAQCRHYDRLRKIGVPDNVYMGPTWMNYTLTKAGANQFGPLKLWHQGSDYFDFIGFDDYPTTWDDNWAFAQGQVARRGGPLPLAFGEYGQSREESGGTVDTYPGLQAQYAEGRLAWLRAHRGPYLLGAWWWNVVTMKDPTMVLMGKAIREERAL